jgi:L-alanine-DL-glutamate epimerase-like enolase superfamily enzyme
MKITDVEVLMLRMPEIDANAADSTQDALIVRVHTDEGITGIGEVDASPTVIKAIIDAPRSHAISTGLREILVGKDPRDIESLWEQMYRGSIFYGRRGAAIMAISGLDIALWDLLGKTLGEPCYRLMGGAYRDTIPAYASTLMPDTPDAASAHAREIVTSGFSAIKFGWGPLGTDPNLDVELVRAIRSEVGDSVEIMIDVGFAWGDASHAIKMTRRLEEFRPAWIEEPLWPDDLVGYAELVEAVETPIATGEENTTRWEFQDLLDRGKVDVIQPDISRCGGLTEARRIARQAEERGRDCVPHAWSTGIVSAASLHLLATMPRARYLEYCIRPNPLNTSLVVNPVSVEGGVAMVPQSPGLGIELDEEQLREFSFAT